MIDEVKERALSELSLINDARELENWRIKYLGRKGEVSKIMKMLPNLPVDERREVGRKANELKEILEKKVEGKRREIAKPKFEPIDITLPGRPPLLGRLHPTTKILREICEVFVSMGFEIVEGPEVEWDYYNFEALNIPEDHPARDMWSTLWIDYEDPSGKTPMLLRTHTSPMQIRVMEKRKPPIRVIMPGKVYRYEATDATHESMFYQVEGLAVDEGITMADLKGTLYEFSRRLFGKERRVKFRCDYFPFVEPGVEVAIDCFICRGEGCRLCGGSGWIEILGAGMVHPEVLRRVGYDPEVYTGFAFGMGIERIPMLRYGIDDIRLFYSNDIRFLRQMR